MDESHQVKRPVSPINGQPVPPSPFVKGVSFNPGGGPKGKRVSTWMAEFGEMDPQDWPDESKTLPANARIALKRIRQAIREDKSTANSEYVEPRARAIEQSSPDTIPLIAGIAAAILALKQSGVKIRPVIEADVEE